MSPLPEKDTFDNEDGVQELAIDLNVKNNQSHREPNFFQSKQKVNTSLRDIEKQEQLEMYRPRIFSQNIQQNTLLVQQQIQEAFHKKNFAYSLFKQGEYFECLDCLQNTVEIFENIQFSKQLRDANLGIYNLIKYCLIMSSQCYLKISQY